MKFVHIALAASCLIPAVGSGHHSFAEFDSSVTVEHEGEIVDVLWRNPHVRLSIKAEDEAGNEVVWRMEAQDLNTLGRIGVTRDPIREGRRVRFAGWPSTRQDRYMALTHLLFDGEEEIVMRMRMAPRWTDDALGGGDITDDPRIDASVEADGIFRVWSFLRSNRPEFTSDPPLTAAAREAYAAFDPVSDDPVLRCEQPGMPEAMTFIGPHPIEFVDRGDRILLRVESDDVVREIHMRDAGAGTAAPQPLGYSRGRFEDESTLVVTTTRMSWPYIKLNGLVAVPQSTQSEMVERFEISADGDRLSYSFTITDPATFTRPVAAENYTVWQWLPGAVVEPYECTLDE